MSIEYEFDARPRDGETLTIAEGIEWLRMPLPFSLNHINLWLLEDDERWAIVDTGVGTTETLDHWHAVFSGTMAGKPVSHVVATHMHPDHVGCAGFLARHFDADFWMSRDEYMLCRILVADTDRNAPDEGVRFYRNAGFDEEQLVAYKRAFGFFGKFVKPLPEAYKRLSDGDKLVIGNYEWEVITGSGHSPEHACLYDRGLNILIAGDHLLPTISPNVSVWPTEPLANPLKDWFKSLRKLRAGISEDVLVLPSHGKPFRGAYERIDALIQGHENQLDDLRILCSEPRRAVDAFATLFKSKIDGGNLIMATGEAISHLTYLVGTGDLTSEFRDESIWYQTS
jgi:glyoxylase-like metal-dependent hydrolase (beta-lactamase superfamily II)